MPVKITLYNNRKNSQTNIEEVSINAGDNNSTKIIVEFPLEFAEHSKRVDFVNIRGEKWTESLYTPEDERKEYPIDFDKLNFTFLLPDAVTMQGELVMQFIAYDSQRDTFTPFDIIRLTINKSVRLCPKRAARNPDLIVKAYEYSNLALSIARQSLSQTEVAERAALEAQRAAQEAEMSANNSESSSHESQRQATLSADYALQALDRATHAEHSALSSAESASFANIRADNAEAAASHSANSAESANIRAANAESASRTAQIAATAAQGSASTATAQAISSAQFANNADTRALVAEQAAVQSQEYARRAAESAQLAVDQTGTQVKVNDVIQQTISFDSDPQIQLNRKYEKQDIVDLIYPIGSVYLSVNASNPQILLGGTWVTWGAGRVPLAIGNNGETNYATVEATGGSENSVSSHNHTQISHSHTQDSHTHTTPSHTHTISASTSGNDGQHTHSYWLNNRENVGSDFPKAGTQQNAANQWLAYLNKADNNGRALDRAVENHSHSISISQTASGSGTSGSTTATNQTTTATNNSTGTSGGNRQPYITCYMWKRTA